MSNSINTNIKALMASNAMALNGRAQQMTMESLSTGKRINRASDDSAGLSIRETMTSQIANTLNDVLKPRGVAVLIDANHQCMSTRGVHKVNSSTITTSFLGEFKVDQNLENRFWNIIKIQSKC